MKLIVHDRSANGYERCVQLINKTNQFNLNGIRFSESQITNILKDGGRLYGATLDDRSGSHGEILACLINSEHTVESLVLSCRVFERKIEFAFMCWLLRQVEAPFILKYQLTNRNEPIRKFLKMAGCDLEGNAQASINPKVFINTHRSSLRIIDMECA